MNFISLLRLLWDHKVTLSVITGIAAVVSIVVSLMIEEKYRSTVVMYPAENSSLSQSVLNTEAASKKSITRFGQEQEAQELIQLLQSEQIYGRIRRKYNLGEHYGVSQNHPFRLTAIKKTYESRVNFDRTKYGSVKISVLDQDPDTAAMIANDISRLVDTVKNNMQQRRARKALRVVEDEFAELRNYVNSIETSLRQLRSKGVHDYESQAERFNQQLAIAIRNGNKKAVRELERRLDTLGKYGSPYVSQNLKLEETMLQFGKLRKSYQKAKADANSNISHKFIVNRAYPSDKKAYPIRWLIVVSSTLGGFLIAVFLIIARRKWQEVMASSASDQ